MENQGVVLIFIFFKLEINLRPHPKKKKENKKVVATAVRITPVFRSSVCQSLVTACFHESNGSNEPGIKIANFYPTEADITSKWGRFLPVVYW